MAEITYKFEDNTFVAHLNFLPCKWSICVNKDNVEMWEGLMTALEMQQIFHHSINLGMQAWWSITCDIKKSIFKCELGHHIMASGGDWSNVTIDLDPAKLKDAMVHILEKYKVWECKNANNSGSNDEPRIIARG